MSLFGSEITSDDSLSLALGRFARSCFTTECCNNSREQTALIQSQPHSYQRVVSRGLWSHFAPWVLGVICNRMRGWLLKPGEPGSVHSALLPGLGARVSLVRVFPSNMAAPCGWAGSQGRPITGQYPPGWPMRGRGWCHPWSAGQAQDWPCQIPMMSHTKTFSMNNIIPAASPRANNRKNNYTIRLSITASHSILHHPLSMDPGSKLRSYKLGSAGKSVMTGSQGPLNPAWSQPSYFWWHMDWLRGYF